MIITEIIFSLLTIAIFYLWMRVRELESEVDTDHRYFEWWMRSMENRKADRERLEPIDDEFEEV